MFFCCSAEPESDQIVGVEAMPVVQALSPSIETSELVLSKDVPVPVPVELPKPIETTMPKSDEALPDCSATLAPNEYLFAFTKKGPLGIRVFNTTLAITFMHEQVLCSLSGPQSTRQWPFRLFPEFQ